MLAIYLAVGALAAACKTSDNNCEKDQCDTVGGTEICMQCAATFVPIDGACVTAADQNAKCTANSAQGICSQCKAGYFMYKGGCYAQTATPGQTICQTAGSDGTCTTCKETNGYFKNPEAAPTVDSCISCGDATGVTTKADSNTKTYKGVAGCAKCDAPSPITESTGTAVATCTKCGNSKIVKTAKDKTTSCIDESACNGGFFVETTASGSTSSKVCTACTDENCNVCAEAGEGKCTQCKTTGKMYLKKADNSQTGKCVNADDCTTGNKYYTDDTSSEPNGKTCKPCSTIAGCSTCSSGTVCTKCTDENYLKTVSGVTTCVTDCGEGYFKHAAANGGLKTCQSCSAPKEGLNPAVTGIPGCTQCTYTDSTLKCTACTSGYKLEGEACVSTGGVNLSTGAIAGISVAAVVVVGGLVGFLCWWFLCRGKA